MKLVIGLGNIGESYMRTRHNIGFMIIDELAAQLSGSWRHEAKFKSVVAEVRLGEETLLLAKPSTMMNLSGEAAHKLMQFYKTKPPDIWAIYDDVDVPFGRMRLRIGGSSSGHQGVNSLIRHIGAGFVRVRIGISLNDRAQEPSEVYVLRPFNPEEQTQLPTIVQTAAHVTIEQFNKSEPEQTTFNLL